MEERRGSTAEAGTSTPGGGGHDTKWEVVVEAMPLSEEEYLRASLWVRYMEEEEEEGTEYLERSEDDKGSDTVSRYRMSVDSGTYGSVREGEA